MRAPSEERRLNAPMRSGADSLVIVGAVPTLPVFAVTMYMRQSRAGAVLMVKPVVVATHHAGDVLLWRLDPHGWLPAGAIAR